MSTVKASQVRQHQPLFNSVDLIPFSEFHKVSGPVIQCHCCGSRYQFPCYAADGKGNLPSGYLCEPCYQERAAMESNK
jgi:hypothetical protein